MGDDYTGRDGWHTGRPVREIGDEYVRGQFLEHAKWLLNDLRAHRRPRRIREKIPVSDEERTHHSQAKIVGSTNESETNPSWYIELHNDPEYLIPRKGRFRRQAKYVGTRGEDYMNPKTPNRSGKFHEMYKSLIERPRITKALEEIALNLDEELKIFSRVARRVKIVDGKRKRARLRTPYQRGNYVTIMRKLIADRLACGYIPEGAEGRPFWEVPGDDKVREYFGMISYWEEKKQERGESSLEDSENEISEPKELETREPGEDDIDLKELRTDPNSTENPKDDIPF